jgi:IMP dehydrogenase
MAVNKETEDFDSRFFKPAEAFFSAYMHLGLTYDDVTLATCYSEILPRDTQLDTTLAEALKLNIPMISSDMDTVTEARMAIAMALNGGLGIIHYNMPDRQQLSEVSRVKNNVHGLIQDPIRVTADQVIGDVLNLIDKKRFSFSTFPVVDAHGKLQGLLSGHVVKPRYAKRKVADALTPRSQVHTIAKKELGRDPIAKADRFFTDHPGIHKLLVVDEQDHLAGLFTMSDIERINLERNAQFKPARDSDFRLVCGAALSATRNAFGELDRNRILTHVGALVERGVDVVAVSTAHGHSKGVGDTVKMLRGKRDQRGGGRVFGRLWRECGQGWARARIDLHNENRCRGWHPSAHGLVCCLAGRAKERRNHFGGWRHNKIRRYREGADAREWRHLRRHVRRLPGSAR